MKHAPGDCDSVRGGRDVEKLQKSIDQLESKIDRLEMKIDELSKR